MRMVTYWEGEVPEPTKEQEAEMRALANRPDSEIDYSDIPPLTDDFWNSAVLRKDLLNSRVYKPKKVSVTAMIDADIVEWLKRQGRGYQTRMNALLRDLMLQSQKS